MRMAACALLLLGLTLGLCRAQDDFPILVYPCPEAKAPPQLDGVLDDACWKEAPVVTGFTLYDKPIVADVQTAFQVAYDNKFLYFGVVCDEPMADKVSRLKAPRDDHRGVFSQEALEFFMDPRHDHANYYQLAVSAGCTIYDGKGADASWNSTAQVATDVGLAQWSLELAVPWSDFGVEPRAGNVMGFNVCRDRHLGGVRTWSNWSQTMANFHDPVRFAHLVLSPTPEQLGRLAEEFRKGDRSGPIRIFSAEGFSETSYRELAKQALARIDAQLSELQKAGENERDAATKAELARRIAAYQEQLRPRRQQVQGVERIDAVEWTKIDRELNALSTALGGVIWEARLSALLSGI